MQRASLCAPAGSKNYTEIATASGATAARPNYKRKIAATNLSDLSI